MPRSALVLLAGFGHTGEHARDIGLGHAPDSRIAARARGTEAALLTRDLDFADVRHYPPADYQGILVLRMPDDAVAPSSNDSSNKPNWPLNFPAISSFLNPPGYDFTPHFNDCREDVKDVSHAAACQNPSRKTLPVLI